MMSSLVNTAIFQYVWECKSEASGRADPETASIVGRAIDSDKQVGQPFSTEDILKVEKFQTVQKLLPSSFPRERILAALAKHKWNLQQTLNELLTQSNEPVSRNISNYC